MSHMCGLALIFLPIIKSTIFWKGDKSIPLCLLWFWLLLPVLSQAPLLGFTSTLSVCVGEHAGHVNCKQYGFYSRLNLTFVSLIRSRPEWKIMNLSIPLSMSSPSNNYLALAKSLHQWKSSKYTCGKICKGPERQKCHHSQRNCSI